MKVINPNQFRILLADDDIDILATYSYLLKDDFNILTASSVDDAKTLLLKNDFDAIVVDLNFEGHELDGIDLLNFIASNYSWIPSIILSSDNNTKRVVEATRRKIVDFIVKDEVGVTNLRKSLFDLIKAQEKSQTSNFKIETQSLSFKRLITQINSLIDSNLTNPIILIEGETGVGKEVMVKYIASRMNKKLVTANMATIPKETAESILFGHVKGSFTGAINEKKGLIQEASGGIFFLDEIGECPLDIQTKLLRVIQEKEILPLGSTKTVKVDITFISATHKNLSSLVSQNLFREDLFYRLNNFHFIIPPLRERKEDLLTLVKMFLEEFDPNGRFKLTDDSMTLLSNYHFPGNIRELKNIISRAIVFSRSSHIAPEDLSAQMAPEAIKSSERITSKITVSDVATALREARGNRDLAAKFLSVHVSTLYRWINKFKLEDMAI